MKCFEFYKGHQVPKLYIVLHLLSSFFNICSQKIYMWISKHGKLKKIFFSSCYFPHSVRLNSINELVDWRTHFPISCLEIVGEFLLRDHLSFHRFSLSNFLAIEKSKHFVLLKKKRLKVNSVLDHEPIHFAIFSSQFNFFQYYQTLSTINPNLCKIPKYFY